MELGDGGLGVEADQKGSVWIRKADSWNSDLLTQGNDPKILNDEGERRSARKWSGRPCSGASTKHALAAGVRSEVRDRDPNREDEREEQKTR